MAAFTDLSPTLSGRLIVLEPLRPDHERGLSAAAADDRVWRLMRTVASDPEAFHGWMDDALDGRAGRHRGPILHRSPLRLGRGRKQPLHDAATG